MNDQNLSRVLSIF
jgi:hypothetical protein